VRRYQDSSAGSRVSNTPIGRAAGIFINKLGNLACQAMQLQLAFHPGEFASEQFSKAPNLIGLGALVLGKIP